MLTKSNYLVGLQCHKLLWITKNDKERIPEPDKIAHANFKTGDLIGVLATKVFPDGVDLSNLKFQENIETTKDSLILRKPLFEAGFLVDDLYSRGDILLPVGKDEWDIIEVKSATKIKDINLHDVAFQKYVYEKAGLKIRKCILMHVNNEYVRSGKIEPKEFFVQTDITEQVEEYSLGIKENIERMFEIIQGSEPEFLIDDLLTIEYDNLCLDEFMDSLPESNVFEMHRMFKKKKVELYKEGYIKMTDIPGSIKLNDKQKIQRRLAFSKEKNIDKPAIKNFLKKLEYPIYYLDFETINPAVPKFDGMKPYQRIPFQFSLHIQDEPNGKLKHVSFLAEGIIDSRPKFMQALKDNLKNRGSILVYNQAFEKGVMNECSDALPEFKGWYEENILPRILDLWDVFKDFSYYDPKQRGSTSIKAILPLFSDLSYSDIDINDGLSASLEYERVTFGSNDDICSEETDKIDPKEIEGIIESERLKVREALEKYCKMDTMAEVEIVGGLGEIN
ncbi:MAG: DUF2779 domain-containing protein [Nanoarchaeota archaeon]|nr:DUF2779 domain-containing protein [Nanoarchaeota archaeon]